MTVLPHESAVLGRCKKAFSVLPPYIISSIYKMCLMLRFGKRANAFLRAIKDPVLLKKGCFIMVTYYRSTENALRKTETLEQGCWIYAVAPTSAEIKQIAESTGIEIQVLNAALDEEERARIELDEGVTLVVFDTPIASKDEKNVVTYSTIPVGVISTKNYFITVCLAENTVLSDFVNGFVKNVNTTLRTRLILQILMQNSSRYLQYLKQIDKITDYIEKRLYKATTNNELVQLLDLQKSLVYISTSLKNIEMTLSRIERGRILKLYTEDEELLEDVIIEFRQAREMAETFASVLSGTIETFSSVISNNLNVTMKKLTSITILLAIPTMISGFYGMNIGLEGMPLAGNFYLPLGISAAITVIAAVILIKKKML